MKTRFREKLNVCAANLVASKWYCWFLALISLVFALLFSRATSPFYAYVGYDAAIFKQMGMAILKGKTIYLDYFDNKGCLLYFIHALCLWLGGDFVILIFQAISWTFTMILLDKIIALYKEGESRLYILVIALVLLLCFYEGGDLSEEWSLPFICYPLYKFLRSYKEDKSLVTRDLYIIGLCFGVIAFLRINNAVPFCGFLLYLFIGYLLKKQWKQFFIKLLAFTGGVLTIAIPCFLYFYLKAGTEGVYWMVYGTFLYGFDYLGVNLKASPIWVICYCVILLVFFVVQLFSRKSQKDIWLSIVLAYLLFLLTFGTNCFGHYLQVMLPVFMITILTLDTQYVIVKKVLFSLVILTALVFLIRPLGYLACEILGKDKYSDNYSKFHDIIEQIPEQERDSIYNYNIDGYGCGLLLHECLIQSNKVLCSILSFNLEGLKNDKLPLEEKKPLWIMITRGYYYPADILYLRDYYTEQYVLNYDNTQINGLFGMKEDIYFFRRK